jgi:glutamyl-tRNA reductase
MAKGKHKNISNRNQFDLAISEPSSPTTASPGYPNTPLKQYSYLNSHFIKMIEDFKKDINNSLNKTQENTSKQEEALKEEMHKFLEELQKNTSKQVKELNKTIQDLKMETESLKKPQKETALSMKNLGKTTRVTDARITNRINTRENLSGRRYNRKHQHKRQTAPISKHSRNQGHNEKIEPENNRHRRE